MTARLLLSNASVLIALFFLKSARLTHSYPIIFEALHNEQSCIKLNIPDEDDTHLLFIPLDEQVDPQVEDWYVTQMTEIARPDSSQYLLSIGSQPPPHVTAYLKNKTSRNRSKVSATVEVVDSSPRAYKTFALTYYKFTPIKEISKLLMKQKGWSQNMGQFSVCMTAKGREDVRVLFDYVKLSDEKQKIATGSIVKKDHFTPLEVAFTEATSLAQAVLNEMYYMEKREKRMKRTADGTNSRILYFSYLSISILIAVTWVQIKYLKGYFKKKKVL